MLMAAALLLAVGAGGGAVFWSLVQVPDFYEQALAEPSDPVAQQQAAKTFVARTVQLVDDIKHSDNWSQEFDCRQVNAWLANDRHGPRRIPHRCFNASGRNEDLIQHIFCCFLGRQSHRNAKQESHE